MAVSSQEQPFQLVIVESPTKARTLGKILNALSKENSWRYIVKASLGHVRNLPEASFQNQRHHQSQTHMGIDTETDYKAEYVVPPERVEVVQMLRQISWKNNCVGIILATDADREGEAIAWHLSQLLQKPPENFNEKDQEDQLSIVEEETLPGGEATRSPARSSYPPPMIRVTFNEFTVAAIQEAFFSTDCGVEMGGRGSLPYHSQLNRSVVRGIDMSLVDAWETRRILDRLTGFSVSRLLREKVSRGLSGGRVQTAALEVVVKRERERMTFRSSEYWGVTASLSGRANDVSVPLQRVFNATLISINGVRLASASDFNGTTGSLHYHLNSGNHITSLVHHLNEESAQKFLSLMMSGGGDWNAAKWTVSAVQVKQRFNSAPPPFTTSTLQQEASERLHLDVNETMKHAQSLYDAGYISYIRTDSTKLSRDAISVGQQVVKEIYGSDVVLDSESRVLLQRRSTGVRKFAQEAHEAIRPSFHDGAFVAPTEIQMDGFSRDALRLYELILCRTLASLMKDQILNETTILISAMNLDRLTTATCQVSATTFLSPGFTQAWQVVDGVSSSPVALFDMQEGDKLHCYSMVARDHHTVPPPRFNESSFIRELNMMGIGRPSTYDKIIRTLRKRGYVGTPSIRDDLFASYRVATFRARRAAGGMDFDGSFREEMVPSLTAFAVCALLGEYCPQCVDATFTAKMESQLDRIAKGDAHNRVAYLDEYYQGDEGLSAKVDIANRTVSTLEGRRVRLPMVEDVVVDGREIGLLVGPYGPYLQNIDKDASEEDVRNALKIPFPASLTLDLSKITGNLLRSVWIHRRHHGKVLGVHPVDGRTIRLKFGFRAYLQCGEDDEKDTYSLPKHVEDRMEPSYELDAVIDIDGGKLGITLKEAVRYIGANSSPSAGDPKLKNDTNRTFSKDDDQGEKTTRLTEAVDPEDVVEVVKVEEVDPEDDVEVVKTETREIRDVSLSDQVSPAMTAAVLSVLEEYGSAAIDEALSLGAKLDLLDPSKASGVADVSEGRNTASSARRPPIHFFEDEDGKVGLYDGPYGPFFRRLGRKPRGKKIVSFPSQLSAKTSEALVRQVWSYRRLHGTVLGFHPQNGRAVRLKFGRNAGPFLQCGEDGEGSLHFLPTAVKDRIEPCYDNYKQRYPHDVAATTTTRIEVGICFEEALQYVVFPQAIVDLGDE